MEHFTSLWGALFLVHYFGNTFIVTSSLEASLSSSSSFSQVRDYRHDERKSNLAVTGQFGINFRIEALKNSDSRVYSHEKIRSTETTDRNYGNQNSEIYGGFQFVDSPDISTDATPVSTEEIGGDMNRANGAIIDSSINYGSNKGVVENNFWKTYPNGTIIHDVRISLVHPANMIGVMNKGIAGYSASMISNGYSSDGKINATINREGRASPEPGDKRSVPEQDLAVLLTRPPPHPSIFRSHGDPSGGGKDADLVSNNATMMLVESAFGFNYPAPLAGNSSGAVNDSTILLSAVTSAGNDSFSFANSAKNETTYTNLFTADRQNKVDRKFLSGLNVGRSIDVKAPCLSECLFKCYPVESNMSVNETAKLPLCLPPLFDSTKPVGVELDLTANSLKVNSISSTASVPVLPIDGRSDLGVASGIEIGMLNFKDSIEPKLGFLLEDICLSESCVLKAADILRRMDKTVDPCDSFYKFACGGYIKSEVPYGESSRSVFSDISSDITARMALVLKSPIQDKDYSTVKVLKKFFGKCMHSSQKELFMDALQELGGWPSPDSPSHRIPQHVWGEIAFNSTFGLFLEYNLVSINLMFANESDKWMLSVDYPRFVKVALNSGSLGVLDEIERDIKRVAAALGIDSTIRSVLTDIRIFMAAAIKYANATMNSAEKGLYSLKYLKARFSHLDVMKKLPSLLRTAVDIEENEMIHVSNMIYLKKIDDLLRDSTVRTQAGHLVLMALRSLSSLIGTATDSVLEKYCAKLTGKLFPHLDRHLYSSTFVSNSKLASATNIVSHVRDSLLHVIDESGYKTLNKEVMDTVKKLMFIWSNRKEINVDVNGITRSFDENPSFLGFFKTGIWNMKKATYAYLHQKVNHSLASFIERYSEDDSYVNAFYYSQNVFIPSSALHESIFDPDIPPYASYGGLGLIVGHELIHSIITVGASSRPASYQNMENCFINQFNNFATKYAGSRTNGVLTKDENIADYGGFKASYHAFMQWHNRSSKVSKEKRLPGLQRFNEKQMFWLTAATNWCRKVSLDFVPTSVDKHAPPEYRIDGQLANIPEFAQDFNCPENSPMNPKDKCSLW